MNPLKLLNYLSRWYIQNSNLKQLFRILMDCLPLSLDSKMHRYLCFDDCLNSSSQHWFSSQTCNNYYCCVFSYETSCQITVMHSVFVPFSSLLVWYLFKLKTAFPEGIICASLKVLWQVKGTAGYFFHFLHLVCDKK